MPNISADLVLLNGKIWTATERPDITAVAIKNGKFIYVGGDEGAKKFISPSTGVIDLDGKRVVPGFNDAHAHLLATSSKWLKVLWDYEPRLTTNENPLLSRFIMIAKFLYGNVFHRFCKFFGIAPTDIDELRPFMLPKFLIKRSWNNMMKAMLKQGITSVTEAGLESWKEFNILQEMHHDGDLKIRFNILLASALLGSAIEKGYTGGWGDEWLKISGVKLYSDGWIFPRTAALREPYADVPGKGILFYDLKTAKKLIQRADNYNFKVSTHAIGDAAIELMLKAYTQVLGDKITEDHRWTIEHASVMGEDLIPLWKGTGIIASIQLSFATSDCGFSKKALGEKRYKYCYAWKTLLANEIQCVGGSDYPIEIVSPIWGIQRIITRKEINGKPEEGCNLEQQINIEDALKLVTKNAAFNSFEEDIKGTIEEGKLADLVVLSDDIVEWGMKDDYKQKIHEIEVDMTIIDGKIAYMNPNSDMFSSS